MYQTDGAWATVRREEEKPFFIGTSVNSSVLFIVVVVGVWIQIHFYFLVKRVDYTRSLVRSITIACVTVIHAPRTAFDDFVNIIWCNVRLHLSRCHHPRWYRAGQLIDRIIGLFKDTLEDFIIVDVKIYVLTRIVTFASNWRRVRTSGYRWWWSNYFITASS